MSGGAYSAGDLVELGISQSERLGSLREPGLIGPRFAFGDVDEEEEELLVFEESLVLVEDGVEGSLV